MAAVAPEGEAVLPVPGAAAKWLLLAAPIRSVHEAASVVLRFCRDKDDNKQKKQRTIKIINCSFITGYKTHTGTLCHL